MLSQFQIFLTEPELCKNVRFFDNCSIFMAYPVDATHPLPLRSGLPARSPASRDEGGGEGKGEENQDFF